MEFQIDAKAFCNYYFLFGDRKYNLLRPKAAIFNAKVTLPMPLKSDPEHHLSLQVACSNDLVKHIGASNFTVADTYKIKPDLKLKNELTLH